LNPETRHLVDAALEEAWQELKKQGFVDVHPARMKLATTIVALASVGGDRLREAEMVCAKCCPRGVKSHESDDGFVRSVRLKPGTLDPNRTLESMIG